ncbi:vacuolar sorting protein VPS1 [Xylariaceae sp. FL1272]|nr:vacuolar sorting protein VPS1 [Xylariaceae sp. FL1272]
MPETTPPMTPGSLHPGTQDDQRSEKTYTDEKMITENPFESESSRVLFDAVDELQRCGASHSLDIPQLVIVGSQSTGKSSLLQNLTDIPFPVGSGCCTRFATRIVSKRTAPGTLNKFRVTIEDPKVQFVGFKYPVDGGHEKYAQDGDVLSEEKFQAIVEEVSSDYMGIRSGKGPGTKNFATQILSVELSGPGRSHFSIVDVPGLFTNPDAVNEGEMDGIRNMIIDYMVQPENIVICVADAVTDLANQPIIHLARRHVTDTRRVGVFTKCDMQREPESIVAIATGNDQYSDFVRGGWFVVRNRSGSEDRFFDLPQAEAALFDQAPWCAIPKGRRGTNMLRKHLAIVLSIQNRSCFPAITRQIDQKLDRARNLRHSLGNARPTHYDRLQYLREVIQAFETFAVRALRQPGKVFPQLRIRKGIKDANDQFSKMMLETGHAYSFEDADIDPLDEVVQMMANLNESSAEKSEFGVAAIPQIFTQTGRQIPQVSSRKSTSHIKTPQSDLTGVEDDNGLTLMKEIRAQLATFEGNHLPGLIDPDLLPLLFQLQTEKWQGLAETHLARIGEIVANTALRILEHVCSPESENHRTLHSALRAVMAELYNKAYDKAKDRLREYCSQVRENKMQANDMFFKKLKAWETIRLLRCLASTPPGSDAIGLHQHIHFTSEDNIVNTVHDMMKVYYQIWIDPFIRHINHNIVEDFVSGTRDETKGPLVALSQDWMNSLTEEQVAALASEDEAVVLKRAKIDDEMRQLETARSIARKAEETCARLESVHS